MGQNAPVPDHDTAFVYVMSNRAMPGMIKIGFTTNLPEDRARELFSGHSGVPLPFEVVFRAVTMKWREVERLVHDRLAAHRVTTRREFFTVPRALAVETVRDSIMDVNGVPTWQQGRVHYVGRGDRIVLPLEVGQIFCLLSKTSLFDPEWTVVDLWQAHANGDRLEIYGTAHPTDVAAFSTNDPEGTSDPVPFLNRSEDAVNGMLNGRETLTPGDRLLWLADADDPTACESVLFEARDYCQVVSRTWSPQVSPQGFPLILNALVRDPSPAMLNAARHAVALRGPRSWAPKHELRDPGAIHSAAVPPDAQHWLPQLRPRKRRR